MTRSAKVWQTLRKIKGTAEYKPMIINKGGSLITNAMEKANVFAEYFKNLFNVQIPDKNKNNEMFFIVQEGIISEEVKEYNREFTKTELEAALHSLKNSMPGLDEVHNLFLKNMPENYKIFLLSLFNKSWRQENVPHRWKEAILYPLVKPGKNAEELEAYRPISMLSSIGKVMEKMVVERLRYIVEKEHLISNSQHGFRTGKSTQDSVTILEAYIIDAMNRRETCIVIYVDLSAAFDRVWHMAILRKLVGMGIKGRIIGWLQSYLSDRSFRVWLEGEVSIEQKIRSGVRQGAILSPFLFNVLLNDLSKIYGVRYLEYADEVAIFYSAVDQGLVVHKLEQSMQQLIEWCKQWGQRINFDKTKAQYFTNRSEIPQVIKIYQFEIPYERHHKFLGMYLDSPKLTWKEHVSQLRRKCGKHIAIMKSISSTKWGADRKTLLNYYTMTIRSKLDYCCHVYNGATGSVLKELNTIQNQCLRLILGVRSTNPIITMHIEANIPPLDIRRQYLSVKYYNKILDSPGESVVVEALKKFNSDIEINGNYLQKMVHVSAAWLGQTIHHKNVPTYSQVAPWVDIGEFIEINFAEIGEANAQVYNQTVNELVDVKYAGYMLIFTDGSKTCDNTGAAIVIPSRNLSISYKLHQSMSILTAELYGIERAIIWAGNNCRGNCLVLTDSLNALFLIGNRHPESHKDLVYNIQNRLITKEEEGLVIRLQWVPAHRGIAGNEQADKAAKQSKDNPVSVRVILPVEDRINILDRKMKVIFQQRLNRSVTEAQIGRFGYSIKNKVETWKHANQKSRRYETVLARLRSGHVGLAQHLFRVQLKDSPLCNCGQVETIEHFLLQCPLYARQRNILMQDVQHLSLNNVVDIKLLLGGSNYNEYIQDKIMKFMHKYLLSTGKMNSL